MNWKQPLYLECIFPNPWEKPLYLAVLEDNPFERWNDHVDEEVQKKNVTEYLDKEAMQLKIEKLYRQIDLALENGDRDAFWNYRMKSTASNSIKKEKKSLIKLLKALCEVIKTSGTEKNRKKEEDSQHRAFVVCNSVREKSSFLRFFLYN